MYTADEIEQKVASSKGILVYFKNDNCAPCLALRPKVQELVRVEFPELEVIIVDSVASPMLAGQFRVFSNPTLLVFFEGKEYLRKSKFIAIPELKLAIGRLYQMVFG